MLGDFQNGPVLTLLIFSRASSSGGRLMAPCVEQAMET